ncbi:hypothetical protein EJ05DRAFT_372428 [Pseudovirgaria hyperparasitica]|uniref:Uncharacterized protein n=1 Tax=Pseudovirgaria hyperparasitica TaxID=470096 RepID=A0A6A6W7K7_9PEZI|nr:uncharacterized protein EJ05DRAFT_372428 [Pseudovirgaria hyperparasitica]KAF2757940.1 hypothetical protein EJ05DRAFT_372428 [Pseudovirgaria hyperparasitica]
MPYGRGGAGNFQQAKEDKKKAAVDTESQSQPHQSPSSPSSSTSTSTPQYAHSGRGGAGNWFSPAELERNGTFTSTSTFTSTTPFASASTSTAPSSSSSSSSNPSHSHLASAESTLPSASMAAAALSGITSAQTRHNDAERRRDDAVVVPRGKMGRGGAGNMVWASESAEERVWREREERAREEEVSRRVLVDVEMGLARPGGVWTGVGKVREKGEVEW